MNEIITQLICNAIDSSKIPGIDFYDMARRPDSQFDIILNDGTRIRITVEDVTNKQ